MLTLLYNKINLLCDIHEIGMFVITGDASPGCIFTIMFYIFKMVLIGMYFVSPTFWDKVHSVQVESSTCNERIPMQDFEYWCLNKMPDIKLIIEVP